MRCPVLVGRSHEVALLSDAVRRLTRGQSSTTLLLGEAGIGKTRLAQFAAEAAERVGARVVVGRAAPELVSSPLWPIGEALLELTRAHPVPDDRDPFAPYMPVLATLVPHWRRPGWRSPEESLLVIAEAIRCAIVRFAPEPGVLVILEDMHWADDATLAVIRFLAERVGRMPIGILVTARTGDGRTDVGGLLAPTGALLCEVRRLSPAETEQMAAACLGGQATDRVQKVATDAAGLPLLVEDLVATGERGGLPQRFADTVRARLERLAPTQRAVLSAAAVLGHRFDWRLLAAVANVTSDAVAAALHRAIALQLVMSSGLGFAFRHALTREVVLAETSPVDRHRLCLAAAQATPGWPRACGCSWRGRRSRQLTGTQPQATSAAPAAPPATTRPSPRRPRCWPRTSPWARLGPTSPSRRNTPRLERSASPETPAEPTSHAQPWKSWGSAHACVI